MVRCRRVSQGAWHCGAERESQNHSQGGLGEWVPRRFRWNQSAQSSKHQAPNSREAPSTKLQKAHPPCLELEAWCFSGAWSLDVGAFPMAVFHCFRRGTGDRETSWMNRGRFHVCSASLVAGVGVGDAVELYV